MRTEFGYNSKTDFLDYLELDDIYMVGLEAIDSDNFCYYLAIKTAGGEYQCVEFGPISPEDELLPSESTIKYTSGESKDKTLVSIISKFLGPKKRTQTAKSYYPKGVNQGNYAKIVVVNQKSPDEILDYGINIFDYMRG